MRMVEGMPCACPGVYHAHVWGLTMRMVKRLPCACHGEFWLAHGIRDAGFDVPYSLYIGKCRLIATCPNPNLPVPETKIYPTAQGDFRA